MSDLRSTIQDDIDWYQYLCEYFNEKPECDTTGVNPYCQHRYDLGERLNKERGKGLRKEKKLKSINKKRKIRKRLK